MSPTNGGVICPPSATNKGVDGVVALTPLISELNDKSAPIASTQLGIDDYPAESDPTNILLITAAYTKEKTSILVTSRMKVGGMKGGGDLTVKPNYLSKHTCQCISREIRSSPHLRQYYRKRNEGDSMRSG